MFTLLILLGPYAVSAQVNFTQIDYPGATLTYAVGVNSQEQIVGWYRDTGGKIHGFLFDGLGFTSIDYPGATRTDAWDISSSGDIVGSYNDAAGVQHGYLLRHRRFTAINVPGATFTAGFGVNAEGDVVGHYGVPPSGKMNGFLLRNGQFMTYEHPLPNVMTCGVGINSEGEIVGHYQNGAGVHGFRLDEGVLTPIDIVGGKGVQAYGISPEGDIVGFYTEIATNRSHGFVLDKWGGVSQIDVPATGATNTWVRRTNPRGDLVGNYMDAAGAYHGFLIRR
jgi:uncharacterized membrane protein